MKTQFMTSQTFEQATIVESWGFNQIAEYVFKRESDIASELWTTLNPDHLLILDKTNDLGMVTDCPIDWQLFIK
jgi:ABC-type enterochelin transport system substrate-binding protein